MGKYGANLGICAVFRDILTKKPPVCTQNSCHSRYLTGIDRRRTSMSAESPSTESKQPLPDLASLTDFQFGPAWARPGASQQERAVTYPDRVGGERKGKNRQNYRRDDRRPREQGDRKFNRDGKGNFRNRRGNADRPQKPQLAEPTEGLRVELRPVDTGLANLHLEIQKHLRTVSLLDLAKVVMSAYERYDLVFMKQENGPNLISSKQNDGACFITKEEAIKHLWKAEWMQKFYEAQEQEVDAPKGNFTAIARCSINNELIGPVNWHGYQAALHQLHRMKFADMPFDNFRSRIVTDKSEEAVNAWLASVSKKTVWKPTRSGAEDIVLESATAVEQDFEANHFNECYAITDKVFVNGSVKKHLVSPGLWSHLVQISNTTRKHPSMLIPNLCHGLARHHMPIFKWNGNHYTGPSRPRAIVAGTALSDSLMGIVNWAQENAGKGVDLMLKTLAPVPEEGAATAEEIATAQEKQQALVRDLLWLCEQGYILVFSNNTLVLPKAIQQAPAKETEKEPKKEEPVVATEKTTEAPVAPEETPAPETEKPVEEKPKKARATRKKSTDSATKTTAKKATSTTKKTTATKAKSTTKKSSSKTAKAAVDVESAEEAPAPKKRVTRRTKKTAVAEAPATDAPATTPEA